MAEFLIYLFTFPNGFYYVGQTHYLKEHVNQRWKNGKGYSCHLPVGKAILKYGWKNIKKEIIEEHIKSLELMKIREQYWIKYYNSYIGFENCKGYNTTIGGDTNYYSYHPLYQIDMKTLKIIKEFDSVEQASLKITGKLSILSGIRKCCNKEQVSCKNYYWCYKENYYAGWSPKEDELRKSCLQLNDQYQIIMEFKSIVDASFQTKCSRGGILQCCQRKMYKSGGYFWCYKSDYSLEWNPPQLSFLRDEKIYCYTNNTIYANPKDASKNLKINSCKITRCCRGLLKHVQGYQFCYLKDKETYNFDSNLNHIQRQDYTQEDIDFLNKNVPLKGYKWCAKQLNRTHGSVTQFVHRHLSVRPNLEETRKYNNKPKNQKKVRCINLNEIFENAHQADQILNERFPDKKFSFSGILSCCKGRNKTSGGMQFEFVE